MDEDKGEIGASTGNADEAYALEVMALVHTSSSSSHMLDDNSTDN